MKEAMLQERQLKWDGCYNVRDLGGLTTADGRETVWGAVVRTDVLSRLTLAGQAALVDAGVRTIIDLRYPPEVEADSYEIAASAAADRPVYMNLPLERRTPEASALIQQATSRAEVYNIVLDYYPDMMAAVMRAIAYAKPGGVVIHCHAGKDRTGTIAALLLRLVEVPDGVIAADYGESQEQLRPLYAVENANGQKKYTGFWAEPSATPDMMVAMLAHVDSKYGGVPAYLAQAGMSAQEINDLKERLLR